MKEGEAEQYKDYVYKEELKSAVGTSRYFKIKNLQTKVKCKKTSVGDFIKKIKEND
jgi:hypothetical protein